jgi:activating signal cointegrator 1
MKTITLTQPWASLVAFGYKHIETRSWRTSYRGPLAIHAAKGFPADARDLCSSAMVRHALGPHFGGVDSGALAKELPLGAVVARSTMVDCLPTVSDICLSGVFEDYPDLDTETERAFGNYDPGRFGFVLEEVKRIIVPVPARGSLGLWEWTE